MRLKRRERKGNSEDEHDFAKQKEDKRTAGNFIGAAKLKMPLHHTKSRGAEFLRMSVGQVSVILARVTICLGLKEEVLCLLP